MDASSFFEEESARLAGQGYGSRAFVLRGKRAYVFGFLCALPLIAALSAWYFSLSPRFLWAERWQDLLLFAALAGSAVYAAAALHILCAGADVLVCCFLPAARGILLDHPTECGFVCYSR